MKLIRNVIVTVFLLILIAFSVMVFFHKPIFDYLAGVIIRPSEVTMTVGESTTLSTIKATENIYWKSGNKKVVTIDQTGNMTAEAPGKTTVYVSNGERMGTCMVTVKAVEATSIALKDTELELAVGEKKKLKVQFTPDNVLDRTMTWESDNENVATVSEKGKVRGVSEGMTTIRGTSQNGLTAECRVIVLEE